MYKDMFKSFPEEILPKTTFLGLALTRYKNHAPNQKDIIKDYIKFMCEHYGVKEPEVIFESRGKGGVYFKHYNIIKFYGELSFITVLHEVAHLIGYDDEEEARGWSCSLYYTLLPSEFTLQKLNGELLYY